MTNVPDAAIYEGFVEHRRRVDRRHVFRYSLYLLWLRVADIDTPKKSWPMIGRNFLSPLRVKQSDYLAHRDGMTLQGRLEYEIKEKTGKVWSGDAFVLTQIRHLGFIINPLTLYYCYDNGKLAYVVGEITNTPWGERHCYVFDFADLSPLEAHNFSFKKIFHVSPFLPMNMDYTWRVSPASDKLTVDIWNHVDSRLDFEAHLNLSRRPLNRAQMLRQLVICPLMTMKIWIGIYFNAAILYLIKRVTFYDHPKSA